MKNSPLNKFTSKLEKSAIDNKPTLNMDINADSPKKKTYGQNTFIKVETFLKGKSPIYYMNGEEYHPDRMIPVLKEKFNSGKHFLDFSVYKEGKKQQCGTLIVSKRTNFNELFDILSKNKLIYLFRIEH